MTTKAAISILIRHVHSIHRAKCLINMGTWNCEMVSIFVLATPLQPHSNKDRVTIDSICLSTIIEQTRRSNQMIRFIVSGKVEGTNDMNIWKLGDGSSLGCSNQIWHSLSLRPRSPKKEYFLHNLWISTRKFGFREPPISAWI